jgi:hypothetical protein
MALFIIKRNSPNATQSDIDAGLFRAMSCMYQFSGLKWITTYWDRANELSYCIYEAASEEQIQAHSARALIPCDEILSVENFNPSQYVGGAETPQPGLASG